MGGGGLNLKVRTQTGGNVWGKGDQIQQMYYMNGPLCKVKSDIMHV